LKFKIALVLKKLTVTIKIKGSIYCN